MSENSMQGLIKSGTWLDAQVFPPLQWAVQGLIPEGMGLVVGPPKLGKSWLMLALLVAIAEGSPALGCIQTKQRPVLYAALEDGDRRMQSRARHIQGDRPLPEAFNYLTEVPHGMNVTEIIRSWMDENPGGVVALDTLGKVMPPAGPGQSAYERDYRVGSLLKNLADTHPGSSVMVVHHTRKMGASDFMDATSGTNGLNGAADYTLVLERARGEDAARIKLSGRDVIEAEYAARMPNGIWELEGDGLQQAAQAARAADASEGLGGDSSRIVAIVEAHPEGVTAKDVAEAMEWDDGKARNYLRRLYESKRIDKAGRGKYTPNTPVPSVPSVPVADKNGTQSTQGTHVYGGTRPVPTLSDSQTPVETVESVENAGQTVLVSDSSLNATVEKDQQLSKRTGIFGTKHCNSCGHDSPDNSGHLKFCAKCNQPLGEVA